MQLPKAQEILKSIISRHKQWGKQYSLSKDAEYSGNVILDALSVVMDHAQFEPEDWEGTVERLTADRNQKAREVNMGKAREAKLKTARDELKAELSLWKKQSSADIATLQKALEEAEERYDRCLGFAAEAGRQIDVTEVPD